MPIRVGAWIRMKSVAVMKHHVISGRAPVDYFAAGLEEYEGRTPEDAATTEIAVRNAVETIGELIREDRARRVRADLPELVLPDEMVAEEAAPAPRRRRAQKAAQTSAPRQQQAQQAAQAPGMLTRLRGFRPGPVTALWGVAFAAVVVWPKAVLVVLFAGFVICLVAVALFGPELLERLRDAAFGRFRARRATREDPFEDMPEPFERLCDRRH